MRNIVLLSFAILVIICVLIAGGHNEVLAPKLDYSEFPENFLEDIYYAANNHKISETQLTISFYPNNHFYEQPVSVHITSNDPDASIYYTTDGTDPTASSNRYSEPVKISSDNGVDVTVLKAVAIMDGKSSSIITHSYFVNPSINSRFSTLVFSLSTDDYNLYDHEVGILVPGAIYEKYMEKAENPTNRLWHRGANYNSLWGPKSERPVHVEVFLQDGARVLSQSAGLRVHGGASRAVPQKSLRLIARKKYQPGAGKFTYDFFPDNLNDDTYGARILSYDTLILRNTGSDFPQGMIRQQLISRITKQTGYPAVSPVRAATVFINGRYYGFAWLELRQNEQFLEDVFNAPQRKFDIAAGGNTRVANKRGTTGIKEEFDSLLEIAGQGLTKNEVFDKFQEYIDVDNLLFYYALETYIVNVDWPENNMKIWRYTGNYRDDRIPIPEQLDGRWRYLLYDVDCTMAFISHNSNLEPYTRTGAARNLLQGLIKPNKSGQITSPLLKAVLDRPEQLEKFANYLCDMAYGHFSIQNVEKTLRELDAEGMQEIKAALILGLGSENWEKTNAKIMRQLATNPRIAKLPPFLHIPGIEEFFSNTLENVQLHRELILSFARERPAHVLDQLRDMFHYKETYQIFVDGTAKINTRLDGEGTYFVGNRVPIRPLPCRGQKFDHWLVNGQIRQEEELVVSEQDARDGKVHVKLVTREDFPPLMFGDSYDEDDLCGFTMRNPTDIPQKTHGLYLSDNRKNLKKWRFPKLSILPKTNWEFVGKDYYNPNALLKIQLNFNPRRGEIVFLSDEEGNILDYIAIR